MKVIPTFEEFTSGLNEAYTYSLDPTEKYTSPKRATEEELSNWIKTAKSILDDASKDGDANLTMTKLYDHYWSHEEAGMEAFVTAERFRNGGEAPDWLDLEAVLDVANYMKSNKEVLRNLKNTNYRGTGKPIPDHLRPRTEEENKAQLKREKESALYNLETSLKSAYSLGIIDDSQYKSCLDLLNIE